MRFLKYQAITWSLLLGAISLCGCGETDTPVEDATPNARASVDKESANPYREQIESEADDRVSKVTLAPRDTPLDVGAKAPTWSDDPAEGPSIVVFYRGHF